MGVSHRYFWPLLCLILIAGCAPSAAAIQAAIAQTQASVTQTQAAAMQTQAALATATPAATAVPVATAVPTVETGTLTFSNGDKYAGEVKNGKPNGQGTYTLADGAMYTGELKDGLINGQGTYTWADGSTYTGEWKDGKWYGQGTMTYSNGDWCTGEWANDKCNGQGQETVADETYSDKFDTYTGEFKDGKYSGQGTMVYWSDMTYIGGWKNGVEHGQGTLTVGGSTMTGEMKDGKCIGVYIETGPDGVAKTIPCMAQEPATATPPPVKQVNTLVAPTAAPTDIPVAVPTDVPTAAPPAVAAVATSVPAAAAPAETKPSSFTGLAMRVFNGVKVYYGLDKAYGFEVVGITNNCPIAPSGKGLLVKYPDGTQEWKDYSAIVYSGNYFIATDDPNRSGPRLSGFDSCY